MYSGCCLIDLLFDSDWVMIVEVVVVPEAASSLLLRVRFARFTNVFSLAVEDLISLLGSIILATWMGLGTSSFG